MTMRENARGRLFVALDMPGVDAARALVTRLGDAVESYKIGLELVLGGGLEFASELKAAGKTVFLDMKLLDIGNTVEKAVAKVGRRGFDFLTVHGTDRKTLDAAVRGRGASRLRLLAVTVLTSLEKADLVEQGISDHTPGELVLRRAQLAQAAGFDGVIASGQEAHGVRGAVGPSFLVVTPGIRLAGGDAGDQARVMTPGHAIAAGADYIVVGRPLADSDDPKDVARRIVREIRAASST